MIEPALGALLDYAREHGLITAEETAYTRNRVLEVLQISDYDLNAEVRTSSGQGVDALLGPLLDDAARRGLIDPDTTTRRDLWDTAIMGALVRPPSEVLRRFWDDYALSPQQATDTFHQQSVASNYIRTARTDRNITWRQATAYGVMDMTINLSKPEKDPRDIAAAADGVQGGYPACLLCRENEGYAGRADHPARQNLRLIGLELTGEPWFLQYSPYRYYNEHCIVLSEQHRPMRIDDAALRRLSEFTQILPHYLIGSNADLPIVGGSILSHDHFQGGRYEFAMDRAGAAWSEQRSDVAVEVLHWPLAVIRLTGSDDEVLQLAGAVLAAWREYSDPGRGVLSHSGSTPHNTITPIARRVPAGLRLDLVLRNNRTSADHPDGIYHPHARDSPGQEGEHRAHRGHGSGGPARPAGRRTRNCRRRLAARSRSCPTKRVHIPRCCRSCEQPRLPKTSGKRCEGPARPPARTSCGDSSTVMCSAGMRLLECRISWARCSRGGQDARAVATAAAHSLVVGRRATAATKKQAAPRKVPQLFQPSLAYSPVGSSCAPAADMPKNTEPSMLRAAIMCERPCSR